MDASSRTCRSPDGGVIGHGSGRGVQDGDHVQGDVASDAVMKIYRRRLKSESPLSIYVLRSHV